MLIACWSVKGGSGTTVVTAALALLLGRTAPGEVLLVDLAGEAPAVLGLPEPAGPGLADWLRATPRPPDAIARLTVPAGPGVVLLPLGDGTVAGVEDDAASLIQALAASAACVVVDCGTQPRGVARAVVASSDTSLLVLRPCYLAVRRAMTETLRATGLVLVHEPGRSLTGRDIADVLGVPVRAEVEVDPAVARAVDAGLLASRLPRPLERSLRRVA